MDANASSGSPGPSSDTVSATVPLRRLGRGTGSAGPDPDHTPPNVPLATLELPAAQPVWLAALSTLFEILLPAAAAIAAAGALSPAQGHRSHWVSVAITAVIALVAGLAAAKLLEIAWRAVNLPGTGPADFLPPRWLRHRLAHLHMTRLVTQMRHTPIPAPGSDGKDSLAVVLDLSRALARRDPYTRAHSGRVSLLSARLGQQVGLSKEECETARLAALMHDIGKLGIPTSILNKPGPLDAYEAALVAQHTVIGAAIVAPFAGTAVAEAVRHHHERVDGQGYPDGISAESIPRIARLVAVADTYDALVSDRAYRPARSRQEAFAVLREAAGTQLDAEFVQILIEVESVRAPLGVAPAFLPLLGLFRRPVGLVMRRARHLIHVSAAPTAVASTALVLSASGLGLIPGVGLAPSVAAVGATQHTATLQGGHPAPAVVPGGPASNPSAPPGQVAAAVAGTVTSTVGDAGMTAIAGVTGTATSGAAVSSTVGTPAPGPAPEVSGTAGDTAGASSLGSDVGGIVDGLLGPSPLPSASPGPGAQLPVVILPTVPPAPGPSPAVSASASPVPSPAPVRPPLPPPAGPAPALPLLTMLAGVERVVSTDALASDPFTTLGRDDLLVAMISGDGPLASTQGVHSVTGAGLTWSRVVRANGVSGVAEIWQAHASTRLVRVRVTATLDIDGYGGSITILALRSFLHVGAAASAGDTASPPAVTLTTTGQNSVVLAVGHDWSRAVEPTPVDGQVILHNFLAPATPDTAWIQAGGPFGAPGSSVTIGDTAPTSDAWDLAAVEIVP